MRSLKGWKALVCFVAVAALLLAPASLAQRNGESNSGLSVVDHEAETASSAYEFYPRANYVWPYATGPFYGNVEVGSDREAGVLRTRVGSFRLNGTLPFPQRLQTANKLGRQQAQYFIVQVHPDMVDSTTRRELRNAIVSNGGAVMRHMAVSAMVVRLTPAGHRAIQNTAGVIAVEPYHAALKLDPSIGRVPHINREYALSSVYDLEVRLFAGEDAKTVAQMVQVLGGEVVRVSEGRLVIRLVNSKLADLANFEAVEAVFEHRPVLLMAQQTTNAVQTGGINFNQNPYHQAGVRGAGQILAVIDNGLQIDAGDMSDTSTSAGAPGVAHRKVLAYDTAAIANGSGDLLGCDNPAQGGFTHGHMVTATAVGNPEHASVTFRATDLNGNFWDLYGVAPDAVVAFTDANITPAIGACQDTQLGALDLGDLYLPAGASLLQNGYDNGARVFNMSFGDITNVYGTLATDTDDFLDANRDAMAMIPSGNQANDVGPSDAVPDAGALNDIATSKNALIVGAHGGPDDQGVPSNIDERARFSGVGPTSTGNRVAPIVMAPGQERGGTGINSEFSCRSNDNDNGGAVSCDQVTSKAGTSFASAAAAGAGLLVRDYFSQGFYPDGTAGNTNNAADVVDNVSGALVKATLISSTHMLGVDYTGMTPLGNDNITRRDRFNNEQGYGRIQLDNALPLENWPSSPSGLIVTDGGIDAAGAGGGAVNINDFGGTVAGIIDASATATQEATVEVCDDSQELRVALAWVEGSGDTLVNDLNIELVSPSGKLYYGNFFTEDDNGDGVLDPVEEDCPTRFNDGTPNDNGFDRARWSLETCVRGNGMLPPHEASNPTEAVMLSPNPEGNVDPKTEEPILLGGTCSVSGDSCGYDAQCGGAESCVGGTSQVEAGNWTVRVISPGTGVDTAQRYALVATGGVCLGSSARFNASNYVCNDSAKLVVNERGEAADPAGGLSVAEVASRTVVDVIDANDNVLDSELGGDLGFTQPDANSLQFVAEGVSITDGTAYDTGNGVLDVKDGDRLRITYADQTNGAADADKVRVSIAQTDCLTRVLTGATTFFQFGQDNTYLLNGGCERNARGQFEFGFPDAYMDAGERIAYRFAFGSIESDDLENAVASMRCVYTDADSPPACKPGGSDCPDPDRKNNTTCAEVHVLDSPRVIGLLTAGSAISTNYTVDIDEFTGVKEIEMVLEVTGQASGKTTSAVAVNLHKINVDQVSKFYSTDFPQGGTEIMEQNNNGLVEDPRTVAGADVTIDYFFETRVYSDLTACKDASGASIVCNDGLQSPWNFDNNDGGFTSGLHVATDESSIAETIANWGEDKNFNNKLDGRCESSPSTACDRFPQDPINCGVDFNFNCTNLEDRDPVNFPTPLLDQNWSTLGGCGWQTKAPSTCSGDLSIGCYTDGDCGGNGTCTGPAQQTGGIWHTGRISDLGQATCAAIGDQPGQCQVFETVGGTLGNLLWWEMLLTPVIEKVDQSLDASGLPNATVEIREWAFNSAVDLPDNNVSYNYRFDTDVDRLEPANPVIDGASIWSAAGDYGTINGGGNSFLTRGWSMFADLDPATNLSINGTVGGNRHGKNACFFEGGAVPSSSFPLFGLSGPPDDDAPEGFCPSGQAGFTGGDAALNYCTTVCSDALNTPCASDASCQGTCINPGLAGFCSNNTSTACTLADDCNLGTCVDVQCNGTCSDSVCSNGGGACTDDADCAEACTITQATIDSFVVPAGPVRNVNSQDFNGPDMRFSTFEDIYGATGNRFQGALGFRTREAVTSPEAESGYGLGVDDMVVHWREFTLEEDATNCDVSGACATLELGATNIYEGNTRTALTVVDTSPSDNDCDLDGTYDGTRDCDGNGIDDVVVLVTSPQETSGEIAVLNLEGNSTYVGSLAISSSFNVDDVLFVAIEGPTNPTLTASYFDVDDGTGQICKGSVNEDAWGLVRTFSTIFITPAQVVVTRTSISDNGDNDGWADDGETVTMRVEVSNKSGIPLTGVTLRATSNDPAVACVTLPFVDFGDMAVSESRFSDVGFEFIMANDINREDIFADITATLNISLDSNEFQSPVAPQSVTIDVDLDATGGTGPSSFLESFEAGLGAFVPQHIDEPLNPPEDDLGNDSAGVANADGYRCQYSDPEWINAASFGSSQGAVCYPNQNNTPDEFYWATVTDRAFSGAAALHWGTLVDLTLGWSSPTAQLEAVKLAAPVNLGWANVCEIDRATFCDSSADCPAAGGGAQACVAAQPLLSFKHQVSMLDWRRVNTAGPRAADRSVVHLQLADGAGDAIGSWIKLTPYVNVYDVQANSNYFNCSFDPIDDGNDEGSFFDPADPNRNRGPSSTCAPELNFSQHGETIQPFAVANLGNASDGPALAGSFGIGTWVEPQFDLTRFRGRRAFIRFLSTSLKLSSFRSWESAFVFNPDPRDDGWFIDDVSITDTLATAAEVSADVKDNSALPGCGTTCGAVTAALTCDAGDGAAKGGTCGTTGAPGQSVILSGATSTVDRCIGGVLQFQFWVDSDRSGTVNASIDTMIRDWTDNEELVATPQGNTTYVVAVRCATDPTCIDSANAGVGVTCPTGPAGLGETSSVDTAFLHRNPSNTRDILFLNKTTISWPTATTADVIRGDLIGLRVGGSFAGTVFECMLDNAVDADLAVTAANPGPGEGYYYLIRGAENCNLKAGGSYGEVGETGNRNTSIATNAGTCPI